MDAQFICLVDLCVYLRLSRLKDEEELDEDGERDRDLESFDLLESEEDPLFFLIFLCFLDFFFYFFYLFF